MNSRRKVFENSFLYIFSSLLVKAINFLLLPLYTYFLTTEDYGIINLVTSFSNVGIYIIGLSLYSAILRFYVDYKDDKEKLKKFYGSIFTFIFLSGIVFFIIVIIFRNQVINLFFNGVSFFPYVFIGILSLIFISLHEAHQSVLKGMQQEILIT